jgi:hypothetical protein
MSILGVIILAVVVSLGFLALMSIVRAVLKLRPRDLDRPFNADFAMNDLHDMLARGQINAEEFEQLKQSVLMRVQARAAQLRQNEMKQNPSIGHGFEVIQNPPPLPPPAPPLAPPPDDASRDAR